MKKSSPNFDFINVSNSFLKHLKISLLLILFVFSSHSVGQVANYTFSESNATYTTITGTNAINAGWDNTVTTNTIPLGFTFSYNGTNYTNCSVNSNGYITFGTAVSNANGYNPISSTTTYAGAISAVGVNLEDDDDQAIKYQTTGPIGNKIFTIQWRNTRRVDRSGRFNFQIKLYEGTNIVQIHYGNCAPENGNNVNVQVGLRGNSNSDFSNRERNANGSWDNNTAAGTDNNATCRTRNNTEPSNGLIFQWTPSCHPLTYCTPTFPDGVRPITNVSFVSINNSSASNSSSQYEKFCNSTDITRGSTYQISVTAPSTPYQLGHMYVYFDWNKNGVFTDANEYYYIGNYTQNTNNVINTTLSANISVPAGASLGLTTMRIGHKLYNGSDSTNLSSCTFWGFGQAEDYLVNTLGNITPTITSFSTGSGCVGSNFTITGTNFTGATSVTIGGTPSTFTLNSATSITVTVGTGTTGTVAVTTAGGTATSAAIFTINPLPANPGNPTSNSPQCNSVTLTRAGTPPNGVTWFWQTILNGTSTTNSGTTFNVITSGTYYIRAQNSNGCWSNGAGSITVVVATPTVITANPVNSTIAVGANTSFTLVASNNPTSYVWQVSTNGGGTWSTITNGGVYSNATTASLNITNATAGMNGYLYRVSATNSCGASSFSSSALLTVTLAYCFPTVDNGFERFNYIDEVTFLGNLTNPPTNTSTWSIAPRGYQDFTGLTKATQAQGEGVNIFVNTATGYGSNYMKAWVDWNKNGNFETTELVYQCTNAFANTTFGFQIPAVTTPGDYRIRIRIVGSDTSNNNFNACNPYNNVDGETEDYLFTVVANCAAKITSITNGFNCGIGAVTLNAIGSTGTTEYRWYTTQSGGAFTSSPSSTWNTPSISNTTTYYVTAWNGSCESLFRTAVIATIKKVPSLTFSNSNPEICGEENIIDLSATGSNEQIFLVDENFEGNTITFVNNQIASPNPTITNWQVKSSTYVPVYPTYPVWYPAISSGFGTNKFIMSTSDLSAGGGSSGKVNEALELITAINTTDFVNLTMTFRIYFSSYYDNNNSNTEGVFIETNTGSGWTTLNSYLQDEGIGTNFVTKTVLLDAFTNVNTLKIRIRYRAGWCDGVAIDDIKIFGDRPLVPSFTWTSGFPIDAYSDLACTIPYISGTPASTVYVKPTLVQLENATFSFTANANLANGCTTSGTVNVTNKTRVWKGSVDTNWNNINNWSPAGIPTLENCVVVPANTNISGTNFNAFGKNLRVKNVGNLNIQPSNNLTIADAVIVEVGGTFQIENNSNLVQINNVINTGNIIYKRIAPSIKGSDYVYWSSPVNNQALNSIYTSPAQGPKYSWNTLANNGNGTGVNISQGNYVNANGVTMGTGIGYLVRGSSSFGLAPTNINSTFTGRPNNGTITVPVSRGVYQGSQYTGANGAPITNLDDNYNLIGNPYPSAINALKFISDNSSVIRGNVQLWKHGSDPAANNGTTYTNPFYGSYAYNYSASDYITINNSGTSTPGFSENIKAGQAFFVEMLDGPTTSQTVNFNNSQRRDGSGIPYINDAFYKNANQQNANYENLERHRIWLDIKDVNNISEVALVGYIEGATMGDDSSYDAFATSLTMGIYSFINNQSYIIQGRSLPFDDNDQVSIGFNVPSSGNYSIGINTADGLFLGNQDIYLKDELLNIYHDLKTNPYSFTATAGIHNDRFKLVYKNNVLSTETFNQNEIQIVKNNTVVEIVSGNEIMDNVKIYDVRGRLIVEKTKINNNIISIDINAVQNQVLIINIVTLNGIKIIRKIL